MTAVLFAMFVGLLLGMMLLGKGVSTVVWDLETTGLSKSEDRIVQFGAVRYNADGSVQEFNFLINPEMPISEGATGIHGLTDSDVSEAQTFAELSQDLVSILQADFLVTYNGLRFDVPIFAAELTRVGVDPLPFLQREHLDVIHLVYRAYPRNLEHIFADLNDGETFDAHDAIGDCRATARILPQLISKAGMAISEMPELAEELRDESSVGKSRFVWGPEHRIYPTFGKYSLSGQNPRSLRWIIANDHFVWNTNMVRGPMGGQYTGWKGPLEQHIIDIIRTCESSDWIETVAAEFPPHRLVCEEYIEIAETSQDEFGRPDYVDQCALCGVQHYHLLPTPEELEEYDREAWIESEQMAREAYGHEEREAMMEHERNMDEAGGGF